MLVVGEKVCSFKNPISVEDRLDFNAMSEFADLMVDYAEESLHQHPPSRLRRFLGLSGRRAPSEDYDRVLLADLAEVSVRSLNTAMIENPVVLNLLADHDEDVFDGVTRALVIDTEEAVTHDDLNKAIDKAIGFINKSRKRDQQEFDDKSANDLFDIVYGSMEALTEAAKMSDGIELYNGAEYDAEKAMSTYDNARSKESSQSSRRSVKKAAKEVAQMGIAVGVGGLIGYLAAKHVIIPIIDNHPVEYQEPQYDPNTPTWDPYTGDPAV